MAKTATTPAITLVGSIMFEGAQDGDIYFVRQDGPKEFYVTSKKGIDTREGDYFTTINQAIKYATESVKNSY